MKRIISTAIAMAVVVAVFSFALSRPAQAVAPGFTDVSQDAPYRVSVEWLAERGIVRGTGGGRFSPEEPVTVRQWAVMLCRAFALEGHDTGPTDFGRSCIERCVDQNWLNATACMAPDTAICWPALLESAFRAFEIPVYSYELYPDGVPLTAQEDLLRTGRELGLCGSDVGALQRAVRSDAAQLLYQLLTEPCEVTPPPIAIVIRNGDGHPLDRYLRELERVPHQILYNFQTFGWTFAVDSAYLEQYNREHGTDWIGITEYGKRQITVSDASCTLHELSLIHI